MVKHHAIKVYAADVQSQAFLTSALDGGMWSATRSGRFKPVESASLHYRQVGRSGLEKAPVYSATRGGGAKTYRILKFVVGSSGLHFILLTEGRILRDLK